MPTPQDEFNDRYITSVEICDTLGVSRSAIVRAKERGKLPPPIFVNGAQIQLWLREDVKPYLDAWHPRHEESNQ